MKRATFLAAVLAALHTPLALAQSDAAKWPGDKPVKLLVPWSTGGAIDVAARILATALQPRLKTAVFVDNKTGASGMIGAQLAATSPPDGYTVFVANVDTHVLNPLTVPKIRYRAEDFEPVVEIAKLPLVIGLRSEFGARNGPELVKLARDKPEAISYGSWGIGSIAHLSVAMIEHQSKTRLLHVPFQGVAPAMQQLMAGQIDMLLVPVPWAEAQARQGKLHILGLTSPQRLQGSPDIPTIAEQGFPGYAAEQWIGLYVPKGTPSAIREQLNAAVNDALKTPQVLAGLRELGYVPTGGSAADLAQRQRSDSQRWAEVIKARGIVSSEAAPK
jgi:tripartite-type tricarboxylate transporter receptor subunit TctC